MILQLGYGCLIKFLDTFIKKIFYFFELFCEHLQSKITKSVNKSKKRIYYENSIWVSKNAEFQADFESVEKVLKKSNKKKWFAKIWRIYALFLLLLLFVKLVLLLAVFGAFFNNFLYGFKISVEILCSDIFFDFFFKISFFVKLTFF